MVTESMVPVNGIELCVETFGERSDPALLLIAGGATSMDWWEDEFCRRLAGHGRFVIRYDHRDTGRSTSCPDEPAYTAADLAHDALGVLDAFGVHRAHLVGMSMGGGLALRIAAERPHRVLSLTLIATTGAPCPPATGRPEPDWRHRRSAVAHIVAEVSAVSGVFTADEAHLRRLAERCYDRTHDIAAARRRHFPLDWATTPARLAAVHAPTLILHGTLDPRFPGEHATALAAAIPGARLVWLDGVGHEFPPAAVWSQVITEITAEPDRRTQAA